MTCEEIFQNYKKDDFLKILKDNDYGEKTIELYECCYGINCPSDMNLKDYDDCAYCDRDCKECWMNAIKDIKFKDEMQENNKINNIKINQNLLNEFISGRLGIWCSAENEINYIQSLMPKYIKTIHVQYFPYNSNMRSYFIKITNNANTIKHISYSDLFIKDKALTRDKEYSASELIHMIEEEKLNNNDVIIDKDNVKCDFFDIQKEWTLEDIIESAPYKIKKYEPKYTTFEEAVKSGKKFKYEHWDSSVNNVTDAISQLLINPRKNIIQVLKEKAWLIEE